MSLPLPFQNKLLILKKSSLQSTDVTDEFVQIQVEMHKKKKHLGKHENSTNRLIDQFVTGKYRKSNGK